MGWSYRKAIGIGPFRVTVSTRGVGVSVGTRGLRTGIDARGRRYTSVSVPGTGWRYRKIHSSKSDSSVGNWLRSLLGI